QSVAARRANHAHRQNRPQRRRHVHADRSGVVVRDCRARGRHVRARWQVLPCAAALHALGVRGREGGFEMIGAPPVPVLWAVHIDSGILTLPWAAAGFVVAGLLALWGAWGIRDEEIPRVALLASVFFVASLIPIPVPAAGHTHLLLNGLLGVVLGRRALLAVPVGLFLQAALFGH